ncbi:hypothetical protein [Rhizobium redzepovicii]
MERLKEEQIFDAVVIDIAVPDEAMLWMNAWLETREIPFIFARDQRSQALPGGFVLSGAASDLTDIVASLFGPVPSYH